MRNNRTHALVTLMISDCPVKLAFPAFGVMDCAPPFQVSPRQRPLGLSDPVPFPASGSAIRRGGTKPLSTEGARQDSSSSSPEGELFKDL